MRAFLLHALPGGALCRFQGKLTSGGMPGNAELARYGGAQRIGR